MDPITREELFLAKAAGQKVETPTPITRVEMFLKNLIDHISEIGTGGGTAVAQSDWNAAEGEPGHILNRPFYTEYGETVLLESTTLTASGSFAGFDNVAFLPGLLPVENGMVCKVTYNGVEYECTANATTIQSMPCFVFGNLIIDGGENTGEPFVFCVFLEDVASQVGIYGGVIPLDGSETFSVSVVTESKRINRIDPEFIRPSYILDMDTETASDFPPSLEKVDTSTLREGIICIYQGKEHSVNIDRRESLEREGVIIHSIHFSFSHSSESGGTVEVVTGLWQAGTLRLRRKYTLTEQYESPSDALRLYVIDEYSMIPSWHKSKDVLLDGIWMKGPNGKKYLFTADENGNLVSEEKPF